MLKSPVRSAIRLRGVRQNNLKNFDLDLPLNQLIVVTGLSGSGKSSLAFDTLFAEGQRRYIETFSPYARQFFDRMDKPQVDSIEGIPPAIAIEQRNAVRTTRSTVGTMTEICDYMKVVWRHLAELHCKKCGKPVRKDSPQDIWQNLTSESEASRADRNHAVDKEILITFNLPLSEKLSMQDSLALVARQGYQRLLEKDQIIRLEDRPRLDPGGPGTGLLTVIQDRITLKPASRARFIEGCEQAYHFGKGKLEAREFTPEGKLDATKVKRFSNRVHCAECDLEYREPAPALFSFNNPVGACPTCRGFGRIIQIDYQLALPDRSKSIAQGVVKPWQTGHGLESQTDLLRTCKRVGIPVDVPFNRLSKAWQDLVILGAPDYGKDEEHQWPHAWYGVKGYFRWLESRAYKMHVRVMLSRYRTYTTCPDCQGARFQPESLLYRMNLQQKRSHLTRLNGLATPAQEEGIGHQGLTLADFYQLPVKDSLRIIEAMCGNLARRSNDPLSLALQEVQARLGYLTAVGLGYLTLDRPTRSLSGGETERVNLTTCLGSRLVNTLFVLDEPSVGLHPRDTERLVAILEKLRDAGNTVLVVEHEASVMRAANQIIDLGPGHGADGGNLVFQGTYQQVLGSTASITGQYLSGRRQIELHQRRDCSITPGSNGREKKLKLRNVVRNNLRNLTVELPLGRFVCITGVSGSGKTTLIREVLLPALQARLQSSGNPPVSRKATPVEAEGGEENEEGEERNPAYAETILEGNEGLAEVVLVDQTILSKTPRSNPAVYIGAFDHIRELFAESEQARQRGLKASAFSFNASQGQCERCRGCGFEKIEMQFLSDVFIKCQECDGRRYRPHILEIKIAPPTNGAEALSIADVLDKTVEEAAAFLSGFRSYKARNAVKNLNLLSEVGLGYLTLGQPINTLSGGESQRLKLVKHLAMAGFRSNAQRDSTQAHKTLFLFDEPTTGLHFDDVNVLLKVFHRLVDEGHSLIVIEHNLDVIRSADWIIDLGPGAGDEGGRIVAEGTPEMIVEQAESHTGKFLRQIARNGTTRP